MADTGCADDLAPESIANMVQFLKVPQQKTYGTANGATQSKWRLDSCLDPLGCGLSLSLLPNTPTVFSVGRRCVKGGFMFLWLADKVPFFITPTGKLVPLDVENDIPYLHVDGLHSKQLSQSTIAEMCGVSVSQGTIILPLPGATEACPACPSDGECTVEGPQDRDLNIHDGVDSDGTVDDSDEEPEGDTSQVQSRFSSICSL